MQFSCSFEQEPRCCKAWGANNKSPFEKCQVLFGWLHDTAWWVICEYIPNSVFLFASFNGCIVSSSWLMSHALGNQPEQRWHEVRDFPRTAMLQCYSPDFKSFSQVVSWGVGASTFFDAMKCAGWDLWPFRSLKQLSMTPVCMTLMT